MRNKEVNEEFIKIIVEMMKSCTSFDVEFVGHFNNDDYNVLVDNFGDFNLKYVTIDNDLRKCESKISVGFDRPYIFK